MNLGFIGRATKAAYTIASGAGKAIGAAEKAITSNAAKNLYGKTGSAAIGAFKAGAGVGNGVFKAGLKIRNMDWKGMGKAVGKQADKAGGAILTDVVGVDKALGMATGGINIKPLNNGLNKLLKTNKFDNKKWGALVKNSDEALLFGKKFTALGTIAAVGVGGAIATKDALTDHVKARAGVSTGLVSNAPVNTYAGDQTFPTMGASYANNAGATGDLALSLHRQRHTGIL